LYNVKAEYLVGCAQYDRNRRKRAKYIRN